PLARSGDDAETLAGSGQLPDARDVMLLEKRLYVESERQVDRFTRRARRRDDEDSSGRRFGFEKLVLIRRMPVIVNAANHDAPGCKDDAGYARSAPRDCALTGTAAACAFCPRARSP